MAKAPFVIIPELTAVAAAYTQSNLIADLVLPRVPVNTEEFRYTKFPIGESFTIPETKVGRKSAPNQVEFTGTEVTDSTTDYGLDAPVPNKDQKQYDAARAAGQTRMVDPRMRAATMTTSLIMTDREKRASALVFNANNYGTNNKTALSGTSQWSDFTNSTPQQAITDALDSMIMRPNTAVFGRSVWSKLSQHPKICKAVFGNNTDSGQVTRQQFANLFELDNVYVGDGWINIAKPGQAPNIVRLWGKKAAFMHQNMTASTDYGITFGFTAEFGSRVAGEIVDPDMGLDGGVRVRVGERVKELLVANDLGYLFDTAVA